jgi:hypothetical protein
MGCECPCSASKDKPDSPEFYCKKIETKLHLDRYTCENYQKAFENKVIKGERKKEIDKD